MRSKAVSLVWRLDDTKIRTGLAGEWLRIAVEQNRIWELDPLMTKMRVSLCNPMTADSPADDIEVSLLSLYTAVWIQLRGEYTTSEPKAINLHLAESQFPFSNFSEHCQLIKRTTYGKKSKKPPQNPGKIRLVKFTKSGLWISLSQSNKYRNVFSTLLGYVVSDSVPWRSKICFLPDPELELHKLMSAYRGSLQSTNIRKGKKSRKWLFNSCCESGHYSTRELGFCAN